jgi:hypothetical protein
LFQCWELDSLEFVFLLICGPLLVNELHHHRPSFRSIHPPIMISSHHLPDEKIDLAIFSGEDL